MPDWEDIVRKHLRVFEVCPASLAQELIQEWASHLEDSYEESLRKGLAPEEAFRHSIGEIEELPQIRLTLQILQEVLMTGFTRKVALPGLLSFASAMGIAWTLDIAQIQPRIIFLADGLFLSVPTAWLSLLPFCGAVGAFVSHRSGSSRLQRIWAALFPSAIMGTGLLLSFVVGFAISRFVPEYGWNWAFVVPGLALWLMTYTVLPAIPLLLGAAAAEQANRICARGN